MPLAIIAALLVSVAACGGGGKKDALSAAQLCAAIPEVLGNVASPDIIEASGIVASRDNEGVLWLHNDSGDSARVFAIDRAGARLGTYTLHGAEAIDWEDMAIGPGPDDGVDYLYLADIGDNAAARDDIVVYRVPEPDVALSPNLLNGGGMPAEKLVLRYPDHAHDAETLLVDPESGDIVIVTKELTSPPSLVFRAPAPIAPGTPTTLERAGQIDFSALGTGSQPPADAPPLVSGVPDLPTGGDVSPDGRSVAIRTYAYVWLWDRPDGSPLTDAFTTTPCQAPSAIEQQGEAIALDVDGKGYITVSEGANAALNHFAVR